MLNVISTLLSSSLSAFYLFYSWEVLKTKSTSLKTYTRIALFLLLIIILSINYLYISRFMGLILLIGWLTLFNVLIYNTSIKTSFIIVIFSETIAIIGELICAIITFSICEIFKISFYVKIHATSFVNILVPLFSIFIINIPYVKKLKNIIINKPNKLENHQIIIPFSLLMISTNILLAIVYFKIDGLFLLLINILLTFMYLLIIVNALRDKNSFMEAKEENKELSTHLKEYEEILSQQQRNNHESKTELAVVRNLLKKDKEAGLKCLDMIIGNKEDLDETFYQRCQKMPSGIQGVVYQKLLLADPNIQIYIEVSPDIPKNDLENKLNGDIFLAGCKIIGVFLGNALEEVNEIENIDNKKLSIQLYLEKNDTLVIQIGNTYRKNTDFSKLAEIGYTTKGKNHGQGLALVQDIENKYFNLKHETIVSGSMIFQKLKIKGLKL